MKIFLGHVVYVLFLVTLAVTTPEELWDPHSSQFILIIGAIAMWRYSWAITNWVRYLIYHHLVFPRWRKQADWLGDVALPSHVYLLVTSFRIGTETTRRVYKSVIEEAIHYNRPVTIVASIVERSDQVMIKSMFKHYNPPGFIRLIFVRIPGTGKRDALASGFRAISKQMPPPDSITAVIDGDSMLDQGLVAKCVAMFRVIPNLGALTTDELCEVEGKWIFREWYNMRFAQRHVYMSSVSLSKKVLTLTGRMSMFRTSIITDPIFIQRVELDWVDHWRLGRFKFLTGDDKSSWYHVLKDGWPMIYVPDVKVLTIETPPDPAFLRSSLVLMRRWFGNMLRTNGRAIKLGPRKVGWFPWLSIVDQRLSMWTSLTGPTIALLATVTSAPLTLLYYMVWIAITRYLITLSLLAARPRVSAFYPFLLYYNQIVGSIVKTIVLFRLDKQKWTRQNTILKLGRSQWGEQLVALGSTYMHLYTVSMFVVALATVSGILPIPDMQFWYHVVRG